ncbi:MAG: type III polyketide synthase [Anaerolineae bacterium]|jgi:predicted naringenin-chalcone synthase|nr:type III polyketide synthase [Anaerolineae bacterium]
MSRITALHSAVPDQRYTQAEICAQFLAYLDQPRTRAIETIFQRAGVGTRYSVIDGTYYQMERTTEDRNNEYVREAIPLAQQAVCAGLRAAKIAPIAIDDLIAVSCTGWTIPGLDLHLAGRLGMRADLRRACVLGMGCYGAFPALLRAHEAARQGRRALVVCVELCSLHLQLDQSFENIVSSALFADGAAMAIVDGTANAQGPEILDFSTHCDYTTLDHMSFQLTDHGFRMYLSSYVPELLSAQVRPFIERFLTQHELTIDQVRHWGIHPGSAKIVQSVGDQLGLSAEQTTYSYQILQEYGNMSSATILFVLERLQTIARPQSGDYGVLMAFGPGLTMEALLMRWP